MKALVGIDTHGAYLPALDLLAALKFNKPVVTLLHAVDLNYPLGPTDPHTEAEFSKVVQNLGLSALDRAADEACGKGLRARTKMVFGRAADCMIQEEKAEQPDLIAIGATHCGKSSKTYLDSATSALALGATSSLLVAKGDHGGKRKKTFTAVFAVDHSAHTDRVVDKLIELKPQGIDSLHLLSAYEIDDDIAKATRLNLPMLGGDASRWLEDEFEKRTAIVSARLKEAGFNVTSAVVEGEPNAAIEAHMRAADLLIIGSVGSSTEGSGRRIGSVGLHQVGFEPYPVLMLRA
ncbi:MAG TPA: universal stress protein [Fimbriimonas sp.]|nr:universal stress protein [Fimbriimonas sp.]